METIEKEKKSLSDLKKDLSEKVLDKSAMDEVKGGKDTILNFEDMTWTGFGGNTPL